MTDDHSVDDAIEDLSQIDTLLIEKSGMDRPDTIGSTAALSSKVDRLRPRLRADLLAHVLVHRLAHHFG